MEKDYFTWIANLGVVPLLRACFFLFAPAFFAFKQRFFNVIRLRDTIKKLLKHLIIDNCRLLSCFCAAVKVILIFSINSIAFQALAQSYDLFLAPGEHREIFISGLEKYTISDSNVVSHKLNKNKTFLLKAKKNGLSELVIWTKNQEKLVYKIHVSSHNEKHAELLSLAQNLEILGLTVISQGAFIIIKGDVLDSKTYFILKKMKELNPSFIHFEVKLKQDLKNEILADIYYAFFNEYIDFVHCEIKNIEFFCTYLSPSTAELLSIEELKSNYDLKTIPIKNHDRKKNYQIYLKIFELAASNEKNLSFALDKLNSSLEDIFSSGIKSLIQKNEVFLSEGKISISTLAEPEFLVRSEEKSKFQIGQEISYQGRDANGRRLTQWKFAGLSLELTLKENGPYKQIEYLAEISSPSGQDASSNFQMNKGHSIISIKANKSSRLFEIGISNSLVEDLALPWLSKIPLLGNLFYSKKKTNAYKKLVALIYLEEVSYGQY